MKFRKDGCSGKERIAPSHKGLPVEPVRILEAKESNGKIRMRVSMSAEFYSELYTFLQRNGLTYWGNDKRVIPLILHYGFSEDSREELEKHREDLLKVSSRYAALNFQTSDLYAKNSEIAMGLRLHLQQNRLLKRQLIEEGLGEYVHENEWDRWDETLINRMYRTYVFGK